MVTYMVLYIFVNEKNRHSKKVIPSNPSLPKLSVVTQVNLATHLTETP